MMVRAWGLGGEGCTCAVGHWKARGGLQGKEEWSEGCKGEERMVLWLGC